MKNVAFTKIGLWLVCCAIIFFLSLTELSGQHFVNEEKE